MNHAAPPPVVVRAAAPHDLAAMQALLAQLNPDDPALPAATATAAWAAILAAPGVSVLVAEQDGVVCGTCTLVVVPNLSRGARPYALIENVVTDAAHRGRGIGRAVLDAAVARAWQAGCYKAMLMTGSKQESTLRFYRDAGFTADKTAFQIRRA